MEYENYIADVKCSNCRRRQKIKIPRGTSIENTCCPRCGRKDLHYPNYYSNPVDRK